MLIGRGPELDEIGRALDVGSHLRQSVKTGRFCAYRPDPEETWTVVVPSGSNG